MEKNFKNLSMMAWSDRWPQALSLSNSNPEPFTSDELTLLTGEDWSSLPVPNLDYQNTQGDINLRLQMIKQWYPNSSADDVVLTAGAQEALYVAFNALIESNDHVVCFTPAFEPLLLMPAQLGARITQLPLNRDWSINFDSLNMALKDKAKLLVLNFPHNPTGAHINQNTLNKIINLCDKYGVFVLSDEVFRGLEHNTQDRLPSVADIYTRAISLGVLSKAFALPAIRLGWVLSQDLNLIKRIIQIKNHLSICVSGLDVAFMKKMMPDDHLLWQRSVNLINKNKKSLAMALQKNSQFHCQMPTASATAFISKKSADVWAASLAKAHHMKVLPGHCFATKKEGFRLSLATKQFEKNMEIWLNHLG